MLLFWKSPKQFKGDKIGVIENKILPWWPWDQVFHADNAVVPHAEPVPQLQVDLESTEGGAESSALPPSSLRLQYGQC